MKSYEQQKAADHWWNEHFWAHLPGPVASALCSVRDEVAIATHADLRQQLGTPWQRWLGWRSHTNGEEDS